jgi:antitoxin component of MazEF toxin-antitoxin module
MSRMEENWMIEYIKKIQKHGNSKCIILSKFELTLLGITNNVKITIDNQKIIIEATKPVEEVF